MTTPTGCRQRLGRNILVLNTELVRGHGRCALLDMDGTLSLIRAGWREVMLRLCVDALQRTGTGESPEHLGAVCLGFINRLTGQPTLCQMRALTAQIGQRGGTPHQADYYKEQYLTRLRQHIGDRLDALRAGWDPPDRYQVRGSLMLLEGLRDRGVHLYLASGTDHDSVVEELGLLQLADFFQDRVYGARPGRAIDTKKRVIELIQQRHGVRGPELLVFGDGVVEIQEGKRAGGVTVGAATLEKAAAEGGADTREGAAAEGGAAGFDPSKLQQLRGVGADILVPHWEEADLLLRYLDAE